MSTGAVRKAITEVIEDACLDLESTRICYMKTSGRELLEKGMELEVMEVFDEFCATLYSKLEALCEASKTVKSHSTMSYGQHSTRLLCVIYLQSGIT